jgi:hypothetical protein
VQGDEIQGAHQRKNLADARHGHRPGVVRIHWSLNFVCREAGHGAGVLIRALEPSHGLDWMRAPRAGPRCCVRATDTRLH